MGGADISIGDDIQSKLRETRFVFRTYLKSERLIDFSLLIGNTSLSKIISPATLEICQYT